MSTKNAAGFGCLAGMLIMIFGIALSRFSSSEEDWFPALWLLAGGGLAVGCFVVYAASRS